MRVYVVILIISILTGCTAQLTNPADVNFVTAIPTLDISNPALLCENAAEHEGDDWQRAIDALEALWQTGIVCSDGTPINKRLYAALLAHGAELEAQGNLTAAIEAYQHAIQYAEDDNRAAEKLTNLTDDATVSSTPCEANTLVESPDTLNPYQPGTGDFIQIADEQFTINGTLYTIRGINYFPRDTPFNRFLTETDVEVMNAELDIVQSSGINTLRLFLDYQALFDCQGEKLIANAENFQRLDAMLQTAIGKGFRLIMVLNYGDKTRRYFETRNFATSEFVLKRYQDEPGIIGWDILDRGDTAYLQGNADKAEVLNWLAAGIQHARASAPDHLITAGWSQDSQSTIPLVDFVSFQHFAEYESLRQQIAVLRAETDKPVVLTAIGYSTLEVDETAQRNLLFQSLEEAENNQLAGWMVYMAFDYPLSVTCIEPACPGEARPINYYGIWNTSYFPKLAVDAVERITGIE